MAQEKVISFPNAKPAKPRHKPRADGLFQDKARYKGRDGKTHEKCFYGKTYSEAAAKKKEFLRALEAGADPLQLNITVAQYVEKWLALRAAKDQGRKTTRTYDTYRREAMRLVAVCGARPLRQITRSDVELVLAARAGMSATAVSTTYNTLRQVFRAALADRLIVEDPTLTLDKPQCTVGTHRALDPWERDLITATWQGHRLGLMAMLMLYGGLRRGEACALAWADVDLSAGVIHVREALAFLGNRTFRGDTKTQAGVRDVPILPPLRPVLEQCRQPSGPVCRTAQGGEMTESACDAGWASYCYFLARQKCGCPRRWVEHYNQKAMAEQPDLYAPEHPKHVWQDVTIRMHDLRHTFCTLMFDAGVDLKAAQYFMGHQSADVTMKIYNHLSAARAKDSAQRLMAYSAQFCPPTD